MSIIPTNCAAAGALAAIVGAFSLGAASALTIDVLWTGGNASYNSDMAALGDGGTDDASDYDPGFDGALSWNLTFWNAGNALPDFGAFDVFVAGSDGGIFSTGIDHSLTTLTARAEIEAARGSRTFLSGQDADFHYRFGPDAIDNGPRGFLINAVNWAASGTGLGIVSLPDGFVSSGSAWWLDQDSFLRDELLGFAQYFQNDTVFLGSGQEGFPVNEGLTSAGISGWGISSHAGFSADLPGYTAINFEDAGSAGRAITVVTQGFEGGGTTGGDDDDLPVVPLPAAGWLLIAGLGVLAALRRRAKSDI